MKKIKVGTRKSKLAITQTQLVVEQLQKANPDVVFELCPYQTKGDRLVDVSLKEIGGKGVFVKDIEQALLDETVDIAIHSLKDMPAQLAKGCVIGAVPGREDIRDCLLYRKAEQNFDNLPKGSIVGTSSQRREAQLRELRPDLIFKPIRGNIDTRIKKLQAGDYDTIVLAMAGLNRMGITNNSDLFIEPLAESICLPAIGQAALGIECRQDDLRTLMVVKAISDEQTEQCVAIERDVLSLMNADCTFPIAASAKYHSGNYHLEVMLTDDEGVCHRVTVSDTNGRELAKRAIGILQDKGV